MQLKARVKDGLGRINAGMRIVTGMRAKNVASDVGRLVVEQTSHRITTGKRDPDGNPWAQWSRRYAMSKLRRSTPGGKLVLFGWLRKSISARVSGAGGLDQSRVKVGPDGKGPSAAYADVHQFGSKKKRRGIPARPYLGLSSKDEAAVESLVVHDFRKAFGWSR